MENKTITAQEGKVFRRKSDGMVFGNEITLGYTYYLGGKRLEEPLLELPEHFEEIDAPIILTPEEELAKLEEEMRLREEEMERQHEEELRRYEEEMERMYLPEEQ